MAAPRVVANFEGFVAKYMGDGVLVYFGYPHAYEDDAERAVRAGLTLVEAIGAIALPFTGELKLQMRVGIATGLVVVGDLIRSGAAQEEAVVGEDAEPGGADAGFGGPEHRRDRHRHPAPDGRAVRVSRPWRHDAQRFRRPGAGMAGSRPERN